jgi:hypothetical protein
MWRPGRVSAAWRPEALIEVGVSRPRAEPEDYRAEEREYAAYGAEREGRVYRSDGESKANGRREAEYI